MFIQIRRYDVKSGDAKQLCEQAFKGFSPVLRSIPGFIDHLIVSEGNNKVFSVTLFKDKQGLEESQRNAIEWTRQNQAKELSGIQEVITGEVLFEGSVDQKLLKAA